MLLLCTSATYAQQSSLKGNLFNENGEPLMYATAVLLNPKDSTMAYYGVSNNEGQFLIKNIKNGDYILQTGFMGYESYSKIISYPLTSGNDIGAIIMNPKVETLNEVQVTADRIPILIKKDTVEYIASAFKTKTDAVAEELLKKLPGVEVDRSGNIKAQGENVQRVLVDGKEFFSSDPKVATKNLPADAIDKVQVYNKKSDETELTGIEDGSYSKTINMILKDGKKSAFFGDITAGYGSDDHYQVGGKIYRFTKKNQFAALGMLNNINKSGFSFQDYLDFKGGLQSLMSGGGGSAHIQLDGDGDLPVNFGQSVNGLLSSGAAGLNFTHEARKNNRFNISYLGNGTNKNLIENTFSQNFSEDGSFTQEKDLNQDTKNRAHRLNFGWKNRIDSTQNLNIYGGASLSNGTSYKRSFTESFENDVLMNNLNSLSNDDANGFNTNARATYLKRGKGSWKLFKVSASASVRENLSKTEWENVTRFLTGNEEYFDDRYQEDETKSANYSINTSATLKLSNLYYLVPSLSGGIKDESIIRDHSLSAQDDIIASLSADFSRQYKYLKAGLSLKRNTKKTQINIAARVENSILKNTLDNLVIEDNSYVYFLPSFSWQYEYASSRRLAFYYNTSTNTPSARQLFPVVNTLNPIQLYSGNSKLKPEYNHNLRLNWLMFDQFSQTSIFANASATYTRDKINFSRTILDNLSQEIGLLNVKDDYRASASIDFSTPIRKLGININLRLNESWNRGTSYVNGVENINTNLSHNLNVSITNRKNEKWDLMLGGNIQLSDAKYSVQEALNRNYFNMSAFTDLSFTPNDKWHFSTSADITRYDEKSFGEAVNIPILRAEVSRYFLKNKRGVLTLSAYDLLDKNKGLERISEMNYLLERNTNVIGRYVMLTFKYRINKFDKGSSGVQIKMNKRR